MAVNDADYQYVVLVDTGCDERDILGPYSWEVAAEVMKSDPRCVSVQAMFQTIAELDQTISDYLGDDD
jgi:hypothetical protein